MRTVRDEEKRGEKGFAERFELPNKDMLAVQPLSERSKRSYDKLDCDGLIAPGMPVSANQRPEDVLVGKISPTVTMMQDPSSPYPVRKATYRDVSLSMKSHDQGVVDAVLLTTNEKGGKSVKVRIRSVRTPQIGDKFASRHGQKGTVGMLFRSEDLPFTQQGMTPDLVMNPHAIPSRMTIGHLFETLLGKVAAITGIEGDASPFSHHQTIKLISDKLHKTGNQRYGYEQMYHGHTGKPLETLVYFGPTYYQRLKHMVEDKVHSRARGKLVNFVRQPTEGRARGGGLRFGEVRFMFYSVLLSYYRTNEARIRWNAIA